MTVLNWPIDIAPINGFFDLFEQAAVYTDQRTKASLRQRRAAPVWTAQFQFSELCPEKWKALSALRARLEGPINCVRLFDFSDPRPGGVFGADLFSDLTLFTDGTAFGGAIFVADDAAAGAESIRIRADGILSQDRVFIPGDKLGLGEFPYMVLEAVGTDASGYATVLISPPLVEDIEEGLVVVTEKPTGLFYLTSWQDPIQRETAHFGSITWGFTQQVSAPTA